MSNDEIFNTLRSIIIGLNEKAEIKASTALLAESVLDSLEFMNYLTIVEETFNIKISDSDVSEKNLGIVGNLMNYISNKIKNN